MAGDKEIKVTAAEFDTAIQSLTVYKNLFISAKDRIKAINDTMKKDWIGDGGTAFMLSGKVLEEEYIERINELEGEINDLKNAKASKFGLDSYLANSIQGAISGVAGGTARTIAIESAMPAASAVASLQTSKND